MESIGKHGPKRLDASHASGNAPEEFPQAIGRDADVLYYLRRVNAEARSAALCASFSAWVAEYPMYAGDCFLGILRISFDETMQNQTTDGFASWAPQQAQTKVDTGLKVIFRLVKRGEDV